MKTHSLSKYCWLHQILRRHSRSPHAKLHTWSNYHVSWSWKLRNCNTNRRESSHAVHRYPSSTSIVWWLEIALARSIRPANRQKTMRKNDINLTELAISSSNYLSLSFFLLARLLWVVRQNRETFKDQLKIRISWWHFCFIDFVDTSDSRVSLVHWWDVTECLDGFLCVFLLPSISTCFISSHFLASSIVAKVTNAKPRDSPVICWVGIRANNRTYK